MALFNYSTKEIIIKIVYYGPGLSGKTTNLQYLHSMLNPETRGKLLSLSTEADRTLFFDFLPVELGKLNDFSIRFQLYTVPGQVRYNATRKLVLKGADAIVFVADSQREIREQNIESFKNMRENLISNNINPDEIPIILQYNKRDLPNILSVDELNKDLNESKKYEFIESIATTGKGVEDTFRKITKLVLQGISKKHQVKIEKQKEEIIEADYVDKSLHPQVELMEHTKHEYSVNTLEESTLTEEKQMIKEDRIVKEIGSELNKKLDLIIDGINKNDQLIKELKELLSNLILDTKDIKKNQKNMERIVNEIKENIDNIKEKKSWFRFL